MIINLCWKNSKINAILLIAIKINCLENKMTVKYGLKKRSTYKTFSVAWIFNTTYLSYLKKSKNPCHC